MKNIQPYIDLGWHTVPLKGELLRLPNGKKTLPSFPLNWNTVYLETKNNIAAELGGAITGESSGIIAIDCDNTITYELFKALDPGYAFHFISVGKKDITGMLQESGTIIYKYTAELPESYTVHNSYISLDLLSNSRFTYVPTDANETKLPLDVIPELKEAPPAIIAVLRQMQPQPQDKSMHTFDVARRKFNLAPQIRQFVATGKVTRALFKLLTPKDFRSEKQYLDEGYLNPNNVPDGRGSEYLSKVSAVLGADDSIDEELYSEAMTKINNCFSEPMVNARMFATIIDPMVEGRSSVDGESIWRYNKDAEVGLYTLVTKRDATLYAFYDDVRQFYYLLDIANEDVISFDRVSDVVNHIGSIGIEPVSKGEFQQGLPLVKATTAPERDFGFYFDDHTGIDYCNTFISTPAFKVFKNPEEYAAHYKRPELTIKFLETLIPDDMMRHYMLGFLRRKLDTFEYSPVILYMLGVSGAGKDTLVRMLSGIIGPNSMARPSASVFLEKHNGWMLDKYFLQLDEYGNQLNTYKDKDEALGKLKTYTGSNTTDIRSMGVDGYSYKHNFTFILTANHNPLMLDEDDRRVALFKCPTKLDTTDWVHAAGGIDKVIRAVEHTEILDFVYYLSTEIKNIDAVSYSSPPVSKDKTDMMIDALPISKKIAAFLKSKKWPEFVDLAQEYDCDTIIDNANKEIIKGSDLAMLYEAITNKENGLTIMHRAMKEAGFKFSRTSTKYNQHEWKYIIPGMREIATTKTPIGDE